MISISDKKSDSLIKKLVGKTLAEIVLDTDTDELMLGFEDGSVLLVSDEEHSCCEVRYMGTDDDLIDFVGSKFLGIEIKDAPDIEDEDVCHEVQFLEVKTDRGCFTMSSHNEHNGYYSGFDISIQYYETSNKQKCQIAKV